MVSKSSKVVVSEYLRKKVRFSGKLNEINNTHTITKIVVVHGPSIHMLLDAFKFASGDVGSGAEFKLEAEANGITAELAYKLVPHGIRRDSDGLFWITVRFPDVSPEPSADGLIDIKYDITTRTGEVVF